MLEQYAQTANYAEKKRASIKQMWDARQYCRATAAASNLDPKGAALLIELWQAMLREDAEIDRADEKWDRGDGAQSPEYLGLLPGLRAISQQIEHLEIKARHWFQTGEVG